MENFIDIPGYEGLYQVSDLGRVYSKRNDKILKSSKSGSGYLKVALSKNGVAKTFKVHKIVAISFMGHKPCGQKIVIDHINNNRCDNRLCNLQLISQRNNCTKEQRGKSKYTGVYWNKREGKWKAAIYFNKKKHHLGYFDCEHKAGKAYQDMLNKIIQN